MSDEQEEKLELEVVKGVAGNSLSLGYDGIGMRIAGSKPWGGGNVIMSFKVSKKDLLSAIEQADRIIDRRKGATKGGE